MSNKIRITCKEHSTFELAVKRHITGEGCPTCAAAIKKAKKALTLRDSKNLKLSKEEKEKNRVARSVVRRDNFIKQATEVHDGRYAYEKVVLNTGDTHAKIHCEKHGLFKQNILRHLSGRGCPQCGADESCGWSRSSYVDMCKARGNGTASLYVVRMTSKSESFIKIGITHKTVKERFSGNDKVPYAIDSLYIIEGSAGYIFDLEKKLHRLVSKYNYKPNQKFGGHTECFTTIKPIEKLLKELSNTDQLQLIA